MEWKEQAFILTAELIAGFLFGRVFIPYFRKIKTGKFDFYIGDRFAKDGSEPKFGGAVIFMTAALGAGIGIVYNSVSAGRGDSDPLDIRILLAAVTLIFLVLCLGLFQDYIKDTGRGIGMKPQYLVAAEYVCCLGFLLILRLFGRNSTSILLPFRLGVWELGFLYYPFMAALMTAAINMVKVHDCIGGETENGIDGLCTFTTFIYALGLLSGCSVMGANSNYIPGNSGESQLFAICTAGACAAFMFWNCSPAKIYLGESGGLLLGGLICVMTELSGLQFAFLLLGIVYIIDGICALLQRAVFGINKKLLLKGDTLHSHLKKKGWGDYRIMACSAGISILGVCGSVAFFVDSGMLIY